MYIFLILIKHTVLFQFYGSNLGPVVGTPVSVNPGLNFNVGFFIFLSKALSRIIFSILFRVSNHQIVGKENLTEFALACVASVSVLFPSKDRAKNGASKRGGGGDLPSPPPLPSFIFCLSFHFSRGQNRESRSFAPKQHGNACYAS